MQATTKSLGTEGSGWGWKSSNIIIILMIKYMKVCINKYIPGYNTEYVTQQAVYFYF